MFFCIFVSTPVEVYVSDGTWGEESLNRESEELTNLCAYLIEDKFIHVHLLKGVILSSIGPCDSSKRRCKPPPQTEAPPICLEVPRERNFP